MPPKICLDIRPTQTSAKQTGTGVYARELVDALLKTGYESSLWYLVLSNYPLPDLDLRTDRLIRIWRPRKPERWHAFWDMLGLSRRLASRGVDLFHSLVPGMVTPDGQMKVIVTYLDLIPVLFPDDYATTLDGRWLYRQRLHAASKADCLIAISGATREDLIEHLGIQQKRVSVVHLAADSSFRPVSQDTTKSLKEHLNLPERYILYLGGYTPRKNVPRLIRAYQRLGRLREEVKLVLAGAPARGTDRDLQNLVVDLGLEDDVVWFGYITDADLPALYNGASLFVYPSLYEGFGLPVMEAMACGTPVVTSHAGSLAEVAGDAALLINPHSVAELASAMRQIFESPTLQHKLSQQGLARADTFSWERCAQETLALYEQVLS